MSFASDPAEPVNAGLALGLQDASLTLDGGVALFTMHRQDVRNALTGTALVEDLQRCVHWANDSDEVRVLVLTGSGTAFCSGGNVRDMAARQADFAGDPAELRRRYGRGIQRLPRLMESLEIPVIAAVNGAAIGAGLDFAAMADLRLASRSARFGEVFIQLGLIPGDGGAWYLQRILGYQRAFELTLSGRIFDAEEALQLGLVLSLHEPDELMAATLKLAHDFAARPPEAARLSKRLMKLAQRSELDDFLGVCGAYQGICHHQPEHATALANWLADKG